MKVDVKGQDHQAQALPRAVSTLQMLLEGCSAKLRIPLTLWLAERRLMLSRAQQLVISSERSPARQIVEATTLV